MRLTEPFAPPPEDEPAPGWGQDLGNGGAGISLLHIEYARAGIGDWPTADRWIAAMTSKPLLAHSGAGLFRGAHAVAFALRMAGRSAHVLDHHITALTERRLTKAHERIDRGAPPETREFDLINGLTGLGAYLLSAANPELLREVLNYLVLLTEPIRIDGRSLPGWWTADEQGGHGNLGLAHGVTGPLALMSIAMSCGVTVPGQAEAIEHIDDWLNQWRCGSWWPGRISRDELESGTVSRSGPQRPSWCYGTPGLARAQQLAALALDDPKRQQRAEAVLATCITDDVQLARLGDTSLCHGWAGLVHTTWRAAEDAGDDSELAALLPRLLACWGHRHSGLPTGDGLLEGKAGVALTRQTIVGPATAWDTCLLTARPTQLAAQFEGV
ncbi:hypothetical protein FNH05_04035 [Amycolatopsis rhizosphaerae]|uniref:Lanthionine synthetase n=1 Tax=Amycolatopsis rhizosphaerae TaxID=2053003 RepID=A0A558DIH6_9PSEU|nr:lanthionine synthetase C family protein [Amycolatopsis rhizosphaerae]TVT60828.1 hypothetical protein FNH05_04035 [Amycolatopsis rhizosphaerae]